MVKQYYKILRKFNPEKDYGIKIRKQYGKCLSMLKVGQKINQKDFANEFGHEFTKKNTQKAREDAVYHAFVLGRKIGMLQELSAIELGYAISYEDFIKLKTVARLMSQHKGSKLKNIESKSHEGTRGAYARKLWKFNKVGIYGSQCKKLISITQDTVEELEWLRVIKNKRNYTTVLLQQLFY